MIIPTEVDSTKEEISGNNTDNFFKATSSSSWSRLKDPRIVRVSKAFGGKDRHSKVCTVRGLRDRRVRLSVPTAIQLYDIQDRLGLDQPSKVVDWLLNAAKHEIDELPPLQIPPGSSFHQILASQVAKQGLKISCSAMKMKSATDQVMEGEEEGKDTNGDHTWGRDEEERQVLNLEISPFIAAGNNFSSRENSYLRWDPSDLKHQGSVAAINQTPEDWHNFSLGSHHQQQQQVLVYQQPYFAPQMAASSSSSLGTSSGTHAVQPIHFMNMTATVLPSQDRRQNEQSSHGNI